MATTTTNNDVWTRKFLKDHGYTDDQIGYDQSRNMVTAGGLDFYAPAKVDKGMSYGSAADLNAAYGQLEAKKGAQKSQEFMNQITTKLNTPFEIPQFSFNPQTDPRYQEAMKLADQNASQATGNALASLASRGIENGSIMGDRAAQIQQQERGRVSAELVPQLYNQAYNQFANELNLKYQSNQDQVNNLMNMLGIQNNQNQSLLDNSYRDKAYDRGVLESDRAYDRGVLESDRAYTYQQGRDKVGDDQWQKEFNERVKQNGIQNALSWAQNSISQQNANTSAASLAWQKDANNPDNIYKNAQIEALKKESEGVSSEMKSELDGLYTGLSTNQISPSQATAEIDNKLRMGLISSADATKMKSFIQTYMEGSGGASKSGVKPQTIDNKVLSMDGSQLLEAWKTDPSGKAAGRPQYEWRSWITDPRGYKAGLTFEMWKDQYGPRLGG